MGRKCKCKFCGKELDVSECFSYKKDGSKTNQYYCSEAEFFLYKKRSDEEELAAKKQRLEQEKRKIDKDNCYKLICDLLGVKDVINTALWKEWKEWNKIATDAQLIFFLQERKEYLNSSYREILQNGNMYNRIRYLSAIIKNKIQDFVSNHPNIGADPIKKNTGSSMPIFDIAKLVEEQKANLVSRKTLSDIEEFMYNNG